MGYQDYASMRVSIDNGVAFVTIDHPPMNLLDVSLLAELDRFQTEVRNDADVRVVVFDSADPDYFVAHFDVANILNRPPSPPLAPGELSAYQQLLERYRSLPQVTITVIEGRMRGAGAEFALAFDMRFGAVGLAVLGQPEVGLGLVTGGGATQHLPAMMGRARALEILLGSGDFDAVAAERYGWINRALPAEQIGSFVRELALRIASFPTYAVRLAKQAVDLPATPLHDRLSEEARLFIQAKAEPEAIRRMRAFLASGGQTREGELDMEILLAKLGPGDDVPAP
ncbi:enoyl-CoA hydratase/isomerase family protein [Solihabitans fulvus]|uniref:Enoyl-CoA hydratase/isomerase family protein n=1 Tax=Solihabitans fulvus TaxID=1892852 RepID=A0A5B2WPC0_9PSEU|nr:enoyl-CoA hydratase/isomerase family protein [Solihabitans fulvus]KAA2252552.1 enoyl-CoA hydratase/isomerase family protein [Solihabitans fulvus]